MMKLTNEEIALLTKIIEKNPDIAEAIKDKVFPNTIINMTPHAVVILDSTNQVIKTYQPAVRSWAEAVRTKPAEDGQSEVIVDHIDGVPIFEDTSDGVQNLPPKTPGTYYIISRQAAMLCPADRDDLLCVHRTVRTLDGAVLGCRGLMRI